MRGMVSQIKRKGERPRWITKSLWRQMTTHWETEAAIARSRKASKARTSPYDGLGLRKHYSGQKSFIQIEQEMVEELGRPISLTEVFIRTHTKKDGTYVDLKSKHICEDYEKNLEVRVSQLDRSEELHTNELNVLFIESSVHDARGHYYGLGSLERFHGREKRKHGESASGDNARRDAELLAEIARRDAEAARHDSEQRNQIFNLEMVVSYFRDNNPEFAAYVAARSNSEMTTATSTTPAIHV